MFDVISVGSATVDVFAQTESELIKIKTNHTEEIFISYPSGTKILVKELDFFVGGGGTNTAVSFSRLGLKTGYIGKVGKDANADIVLNLLKKEKVSFLGGKGKATGYSIILDSIESDRTILTYKGANNDLTFKEIKNKKAKWYYFSSMMEASWKTSEQLVSYAKKNNIKVAFNPSSYQAKSGIDALQMFLENTTVLVLNKEEAKYIVGPLVMDNLLKKLKETGPEIVVITDAKNGVYCYDGVWFYHLNAAKHIPVKETTGAGDAFASTFVAGLAMNKPIQTCLKMGMINAESVIQYYGAKNILLSRKALFAKLAKDNRTVFKHKI
ncbi:carbohydrate kinase family protein [Candidatus Woesearchaeota archaeon]|nr:MAG: carbohydrate kinase family protein [Candidatus Woesearchaeota archaeon]